MSRFYSYIIYNLIVSRLANSCSSAWKMESTQNCLSKKRAYRLSRETQKVHFRFQVYQLVSWAGDYFTAIEEWRIDRGAESIWCSLALKQCPLTKWICSDNSLSFRFNKQRLMNFGSDTYLLVQMPKLKLVLFGQLYTAWVSRFTWVITW